MHSQGLNIRQLPLRRRDLRGGTSYLDYFYTYDENGNLTGIADNRVLGNETRTMVYDSVDRLTRADALDVLGPEIFEYDPLDNLRAMTYPGRGDLGILYGYDVQNRLSTIAMATTAGGQASHSYQYDSRGNMTSGLHVRNEFTPGVPVERQQVFDQANRLLSATTGGQAEHYRYDGHGRRTRIQRSGGVTYQVYGRDGRFLLERTPTGALVQYVHLGNRLLARAAGGAVTYQHTDQLGSVVRRTNAVGVVMDSTIYAPFGSVQSGVLSQGPAFTGHVSDQSSGLSYMQQRYHDPLAMRFISVDPVLPGTTDGGNFNRYWYANNNPYKFVDPDGRESGCLYGGGCGGPASAAQNAVFVAALDYMPVVGDIKGIVDAIADPSAGNIVAAAAGLMGPVGDSVAAMMKRGGNIVENSVGPRGSCPSCGGRTSSSESAIARDHDMPKRDVGNSIHQAKDNGSDSGDFGRNNGNVEVCRDCGEIFPKTPNNGLGDSIGNIRDPIERK